MKKKNGELKKSKKTSNFRRFPAFVFFYPWVWNDPRSDNNTLLILKRFPTFYKVNAPNPGHIQYQAQHEVNFKNAKYSSPPVQPPNPCRFMYLWLSLYFHLLKMFFCCHSWWNNIHDRVTFYYHPTLSK